MNLFRHFPSFVSSIKPNVYRFTFLEIVKPKQNVMGKKKLYTVFEDVAILSSLSRKKEVFGMMCVRLLYVQCSSLNLLTDFSKIWLCGHMSIKNNLKFGSSFHE